MTALKKPTYIIDQNGKKKGVILDMKAYQTLMEQLEDLNDLKYVKEHLSEEAIPYKTARKRLFSKK